jgi:hypothetical protein
MGSSTRITTNIWPIAPHKRRGDDNHEARWNESHSGRSESGHTHAADDYQAQRLEQAATYGELKAVQTGGQMTRQLNTTLGNIDAVRAAANTDPSSPTGAALRDNAEQIGTDQKTTTVDSILQQSLQLGQTRNFIETHPRGRCYQATFLPVRASSRVLLALRRSQRRPSPAAQASPDYRLRQRAGCIRWSTFRPSPIGSLY